MTEYYEAKRDEGKQRPSLIPWGGIKHIVDIAEFGVRKGYAPHSWKTVPDARERYGEALSRHFLLAMEEGWWAKDAESGKPHLGHIGWNALALLALGPSGGGDG